MAAPEYRWKESIDTSPRRSGMTVVASLGGDDVGHITVPHIALRFPGGICVPLAGIAGVGVDAGVRRRGIAAAMMQRVAQFARERGYACSAVSTDYDNPARRLYTRAGHEYLFTQYSYSGPLGQVSETAPQNVLKPPQGTAVVRPFCADDADAVLAFIERVESPYFGTCDKVIEQCGGYMGYVAEQNGKIIGSCNCFPLRLGLEANIFVAGRQRLAVAELLLNALAAKALESGRTELHFSIPQDDRPLAHLLWQRGFRPQPSHVFMFGILDLQRLLELLQPMWEQRTDGLDGSNVPERIVVRMQDQTGTLRLHGRAPPIAVQGSRYVMTRVVCGTISAWEAYLCGCLAVRPEPTERTAEVLGALLPAVPYHNPGTDRW